jgi:hypothetical protein
VCFDVHVCGYLCEKYLTELLYLTGAPNRSMVIALVREDSGASIGGKAGTVQHFGKESGLPRKVQESIDAVPAATFEAAESIFEALVGLFSSFFFL